MEVSVLMQCSYWVVLMNWFKLFCSLLFTPTEATSALSNYPLWRLRDSIQSQTKFSTNKRLNKREIQLLWVSVQIFRSHKKLLDLFLYLIPDLYHQLYKQFPFAMDFNATWWLAGLQSMSGIRLVPRSSFASLLKSTLSSWTTHNKLRSLNNFLHDSKLFAFSKVCNEFKASFDLEFDDIFMIWPGIRSRVNFTLQWLHVLLVHPRYFY